MNMYKVLDQPRAYNFVQRLFGSAAFNTVVRETLKPFRDRKVLELGSGTGAFTQTDFRNLYASDINGAYLKSIDLPATRKLPLSAGQLASLPDDYDLIYSVGLFHHLDDIEARESLRQSRQHLKTDGKVIVIDSILPSSWNPIALGVRKADRGAFVRSLSELRSLVGGVAEIESMKSDRYSWCNLEYAVVICGK